MALVVLRASFARSSSVKSLLGAKVHPAAATAPIQVATLKATYGGPYPYQEPYPYETKAFTMVHEFFDKTAPRICENSKIITVDGNLAVGKNEFAKRLAKEFDLRYIPSVPDSEAFRLRHNNYDLRELNMLLPERCHLYDWKTFLKEQNLERGFVGRLQLQWYREKWDVYSKALQHLFHTGQGCVIVRSCFSDHVFAEAMRRCGYVTKNFLKYYYYFRDNSLCELLKPHLSIYLDAPVDVIKQRLKARGNADEVNSKAINDHFLKTMEDVYKQNFIPKMRETGEVLEVDWSEIADELDMDVIAAEIATLHYEAEDINDPRFQDWYKLTEDKMSMYRRNFGQPHLARHFLTRPFPTDCPEILYDVDDYKLMFRTINLHPAVRYEAGTAAELGNSTILKFP